MDNRYSRAIGIAEFIVEGHTLAETADDFCISRWTVQRELDFLSQCGYGEEYKRNMMLYRKAKAQLQNNIRKK